MTLNTWKQEFYPRKPSKRMTRKAAIEHSLKKWRGLTKGNLKKHGLQKDNHLISETGNETENFCIDGDSCALCVKYFDDDPRKFHPEDCAKCPLFKALGKPCDGADEGVGISPYSRWIRSDNALPMIKALEKTLEQNT